ncbi:TonB-dependent receptor [Maricurvus nonylphenolicus]|uniref:TonB-dependent receptor n=1 Tax=Maricurvus nonylphenolicus TaxID=1008307 RepID=UPI0036F239FC
MSKTFTRNLTAVAVAVAVQTMSGYSLAEAGEETFSLEEIIVTAQKREQSLQDVPSTVNAIQGDALTDKKLFNFTDLEQVSPGLELRSIDGRAGSIALRGVDFNPNSGASAAVDVYWNDVTLGTNASGGVFQEMFDLGRVELLRGPQGTLQGRTSPAGAVAIHTAKPDMEEVEGYVRTTFTDNSGTNTQFASSLPIIPGELSVRVAGVYSDSELSEVKNYVDGDVSDTQTKAGRISVAWQPSDEFAAEFVYQYVENDLSNYSVLTGTSTLGQGLPTLSGSDLEAIQTQADVYNGRFENVSLKLDWEVLGHQVTFVSGYSEVSSVRDFDNALGNTKIGFDDHPVLTALYPQIGLTGTQLNNPQRMLDQNYASSQELRIASMDNEFWDYTVGVYYGNESGFYNNEFMREQFFGPASLYFDTVASAPFDIQSYGAFAHNIFYLNDQWTAQVGIRWQRQERTVESSLYAAEDTTAPNPALVFSEGDELAQLIPDDLESLNSEAWTGSVSLQYAFADYDASAYVSAATSFRPGGATVSNKDLGELTEYNEEDSWSLEVGVKSSWLDNRLRLNSAIFYQDYSDYIGRANRVSLNPASAANGGEGSITTNGDATVQGVEVDFEYLMAENWHIAGGVSYVEAEYKDGVTLPSNDCAFVGTETAAMCDVGGLELGTQAPFTASLSTDYTIPMDAFEIYMLGLYKFTGRRTDTDAPSGDLGGYGTFDLHLGLREASATWDVSLFVRNLFDKEATDNLQPESKTFGRAPIETTGYLKTGQIAPRLIGLSATYNF